MTEVKLRGVSESVTEQDFNAAMKAHSVHGHHLRDQRHRENVRVTTAQKSIQRADGSTNKRQIFYFVVHHGKTIDWKCFTVPKKAGKWQDVHDKVWHRGQMPTKQNPPSRPQVAPLPVTRALEESKQAEEGPLNQDSAEIHGQSNKSRKIDALETQRAREFLNMPTGDVRAQLEKLIEVLELVVLLKEPLER